MVRDNTNDKIGREDTVDNMVVEEVRHSDKTSVVEGQEERVVNVFDPAKKK